MTQKDFIESKIEELSQHLAENYYYTDFISKKKFHNKLSTALKEIVEEAYKKILPGEKSHSSIYDYDIGYNDAIQEVADNIEEFLKTK